MSRKIIALIAGATIALAGATAIAGHHEDGEKKYKKMKHHNWEERFEERFTKMDANSDGQITEEEFLAYRAEKAKKKWAEKWATAAGDDAAVSREEAKAAMKERHKKYKEGKYKHKHKGEDKVAE